MCITEAYITPLFVYSKVTGEPGLVDRGSPCTQEVEGSTPTGGTWPNDLSDLIDQDIRTQWALELENSGIRVTVGDCSVTERRRWRPPYQTGKTVHLHATHYKHNKDGRTAPGVCGNGSVPLSHSGNRPSVGERFIFAPITWVFG